MDIDNTTTSDELRDEHRVQATRLHHATAVFWVASGGMLGALLFCLVDALWPRLLIAWIFSVVGIVAIFARGAAIEQVEEIDHELCDRLMRDELSVRLLRKLA